MSENKNFTISKWLIKKISYYQKAWGNGERLQMYEEILWTEAQSLVDRDILMWPKKLG